MFSKEGRMLFLRYAVPCGSVLASRGDLEEERLQYLKGCALEGRQPEGDLEDDFPIAVRMCKLLAKRAGKDVIDCTVVRDYFLREHESAVEWRMQIYSDVGPECLVERGNVLEVGPGSLEVDAGGKRKRARLGFVSDVRPGDTVSIHYGQAIEKL